VYKCAINPIINPNPVYNHIQSRDNMKITIFWDMTCLLVTDVSKETSDSSFSYLKMKAIDSSEALVSYIVSGFRGQQPADR
jgi:hypothetical protein